LAARDNKASKKGKRFFFEKKAPRPGKQKTFGTAGVGAHVPQPAVKRKFFCFFFFKKRSASFPYPARGDAAHPFR
jgi:hypothetical protein